MAVLIYFVIAVFISFCVTYFRGHGDGAVRGGDDCASDDVTETYFPSSKRLDTDKEQKQ